MKIEATEVLKKIYNDLEMKNMLKRLFEDEFMDFRFISIKKFIIFIKFIC